MSFQAMAWALKQNVGGSVGKLVLIALANYADEKGECYPSQKTLAKECECSDRTIRSWLSVFKEMGIIKTVERRRQDGFRTSNLIKFNMDKEGKISPETISEEIISQENNDTSQRKSFPNKNLSDITYQLSNNNAGARAINNDGQKPQNPPQQKNSDKQFDEFWNLYPNKVGKGAARISFLKALKLVDFDILIQGLQRYANKTDDRAWCNPSTWLNQERWEDEPAQEQQSSVVAFSGGQQHKKSMSELFLEGVQEFEQ